VLKIFQVWFSGNRVKIVFPPFIRESCYFIAQRRNHSHHPSM
jgi:hypothetical protein